MKQETIEEAAKRMYGNDEDGYYAQKRAFKIGAKWQQERSYNEEDIREAFKFYAERVICDIKYLDDDFTEFIKQFKKK
jgi:hypothetical protein